MVSDPFRPKNTLSARDVKLLVKSGILESMLPDSEAAWEFINSLDLGPILGKLETRLFQFTMGWPA